MSYPLQQPAPQERKPSWFKIVAAGCALLIVGFLAFIAVIIFVVFGAIKRSDPYSTAFQRATHDPRVVAALGKPIESGLLIRGHVNMNDERGDCDLRFSILGAKQNADVHVVGMREDRQWHYTTLTVTPGEGSEIDLLK
jgi:hypothetical protein